MAHRVHAEEREVLLRDRDAARRGDLVARLVREGDGARDDQVALEPEERLEELVRYLLVVKGANPDATRHH